MFEQAPEPRGRRIAGLRVEALEKGLRIRVLGSLATPRCIKKESADVAIYSRVHEIARAIVILPRATLVLLYSVLREGLVQPAIPELRLVQLSPSLERSSDEVRNVSKILKALARPRRVDLEFPMAESPAGTTGCAWSSVPPRRRRLSPPILILKCAALQDLEVSLSGMYRGDPEPASTDFIWLEGWQRGRRWGSKAH